MIALRTCIATGAAGEGDEHNSLVEPGIKLYCADCVIMPAPNRYSAEMVLN